MQERTRTQAPTVIKEIEGDAVFCLHHYKEAADYYRGALSSAYLTPDERFRITEKLLSALFLSDDPDEIKAWLDSTLQGDIELRDTAHIIRMLKYMCHQLWLEGKTPATIPLVEHVLRIAEKNGDHQLLCISNYRMATSLNLLGHFDKASVFLDRIAVEDESDDRFTTHYYLERSTIFAASGQAVAARAEFQRALEAAKNEPDIYRITVLWSNRAHWTMLLGDIKEAKNSLEQALLIARRANLGWQTTHLCLRYAQLLFRLEAYDGAWEYLLKALDSGVHVPFVDEYFVATGIPLALHMQDKRILARCLRPAVIAFVFRSQEPARICRVVSAYAQYYVTQGERSEAPGLLHRALRYLHYIDEGLDLALDVARYGSSADVHYVRALLEKRIELPSADVIKAHRAFFEAIVAQRHGKTAEGIAYAKTASEQFAALEWHRNAHQVNVFLAEASGDTIALKPSRTSRPFVNLHVTLTEREQEVAALVLRGLTNHEIAEQLSIREHTVEKHVSAIMKAVGIRSRHQLVDVSVN